MPNIFHFSRRHYWKFLINLLRILILYTNNYIIVISRNERIQFTISKYTSTWNVFRSCWILCPPAYKFECQRMRTYLIGYTISRIRLSGWRKYIRSSNLFSVFECSLRPIGSWNSSLALHSTKIVTATSV